MKLITLQNLLDNQEFFVQEAKAGKIFIYPTDTIYGIGGIYEPATVNKVFLIKKRDEKKMFSIIAPSFDWIMRNYQSPVSNFELQKYLDSYHGVTYIFDYEKPGVRIIKHPFQSFVQALGEAFITTSCNLPGEAPISDIKNIPTDFASQVDYIIDGWILGGKPSVLIDLVENKIIER